ncbi:kelch repeat-containing protein [Streptomyces sp. NPDC001002]
MTVSLTEAANAVQGPGSWASVGELPWARSHFGADGGGAVLLADGRVLVVGGADGALTATAEAAVLDPAAMTWTATGPLATGRRIHTATRLKDGRVLVAGGQQGAVADPLRPLASAEIYHPASGTWSATGAMAQGRFGHSASLLPDGRVLVAGGHGLRTPSANTPLYTAELYDPDSGTWSPAAPMNDARFRHPAITLPDGRVLVVGGLVTFRPGYGVGLAFCEIYDPDTHTWSPAGTMATPRHSHQATLLSDGTVLATGGGDPGAGADSGYVDPYSRALTERYLPATDTWIPDTPMPTGRTQHCAFPLAGGRLLVAGGTNDVTLDTGYRNAVVYDPLTRAWTPAAPMALPRWQSAFTSLSDGRALVVGGAVRNGYAAARLGDDVLTATAEVFTPPP